MKKKKKKKFKIKFFVVVLLFITVDINLFLKLRQNINDIKRENENKISIINDIEKVKEDNLIKEKENKNLENPDYYANIIREKRYYSKDGEINLMFDE